MNSTIPLPYYRTVDMTIGGVLSLCLVFGVTANVVALVYFIGKKNARSNNAQFFRSVYMIICTVDSLICLTLVPSIEAAFTENRNGKIFRNHSACAVWNIIWQVLPEMSVFLVAFISISRLIILVKPTRQLLAPLAWILPAAYFLLTTGIKIGLQLAGKTMGHYLQRTMSCKTVAKLTDPPYGIVIKEEWAWETVIRVLSNIQTGLTIIPITMSCILSVIYLHRSKMRCAAKVKGSAINLKAKQNEATLTIIIITVVYIVCNIPTFSYFVYHLQWVAESNIVPGDTIISEIAPMVLEHFDTDFKRYFMWIVFYTVFIAVNSTINPAVYYFRMKHFKEYIKGRFRFTIRLSIKMERKTVEDAVTKMNNVSKEPQNSAGIASSSEL